MRKATKNISRFCTRKWHTEQRANILTSTAMEKEAQENLNLVKHFANFHKPTAYTMHHDYALSKNRIGPVPFVLQNDEFETMQIIADAINVAVPAFIRAWHVPANDPNGSKRALGHLLRGIVTLPPRIERLLMETVPLPVNNTSMKWGTMRPDLVMFNKNDYRVCEINARFALNGYLLSAFLNEAVRIQSCSQESIAAQLLTTSIPHMHSFIADLRSNVESTVWVIRDKEPLKYDMLLLERSLLDVQVNMAVPSDLTVNNNGELVHSNGQIISNCILELHQDELLSLSDSVLRALLILSDKGKCMNHLRTIFLAHDKRLLSLFSGFYGEEVLLNIVESVGVSKVLQKHVMPTALVSEALNPNAMQSSNAWSFVGGGTNHSVIYKPSLSGKGAGIQLSHDFPKFESFVGQLQANQSSYFAQGILQPFLQTTAFPTPVFTDSDGWHQKSLPTVATLLCMNGEFYGPGIFRAQDSEIIALSRGGFCSPAALTLPEVPANARFLLDSELLDGKHDNDAIMSMRRNMREAFARHGAIFSTIDDKNSIQEQSWWNNSSRLQYFVDSVFGGVSTAHLKQTESAVWDIRASSNSSSKNVPLARSHTLQQFDVHTDASWEPSPPQCLAISVVNADRKNGGKLAILDASNMLSKFSHSELEQLHQLECSVTTPPEFRHEGSTNDEKTLPFMLGKDRLRFRYDIMSHSETLNKFYQIASKCAAEKSNHRLIPERCVIVFDNQRFLHARTQINDNRRHLKRVRFNLPEYRLPQLDMVLLDKAKELGIPTTLEISDFTVSPVYPIPHHSLENIYWSPSGQSGTMITQTVEQTMFDNVVGTNSTGNDLHRSLFASAVKSSGTLHSGIRCANLFSFGNLYRSGEIIGELLRACQATNYTLGSLASEEVVAQMLDSKQFGVNAIGAFSTKLVFLANAAAKGLINMKNIKLVIYGGEPLPLSQRKLLRSVCHPSLEILGLYGSAETGVFAFQCNQTQKKAQKLTNSKEEIVNVYEYVDDIVHIENVKEEDSELGKLVVTNLIRKPYLVRFDTGDLVSTIGTNSKLFWLHGRSKSTRAVGMGNGWIYFDEMVATVLKPLGMEESVAQIWLDDSDSGTVIVTLVLMSHSTMQEQKLQSEFRAFVQDSIGLLGIDTQVLVTSKENMFVRSKRSQKLLKFVDRRIGN